MHVFRFLKLFASAFSFTLSLFSFLKKRTADILRVYLCSKHRCPHRPYGVVGKSDQPCAVTEYRSEFVPREGGGMRESFKPEFTLQSSAAPLEDETTHK
jgi:hypothetical protein